MWRTVTRQWIYYAREERLTINRTLISLNVRADRVFTLRVINPLQQRGDLTFAYRLTIYVFLKFFFIIYGFVIVPSIRRQWLIISELLLLLGWKSVGNRNLLSCEYRNNQVVKEINWTKRFLWGGKVTLL